MTSPSISVIVPVFNCERYLAEALESIYAQDYAPLEVVVVDDGSTDRSAEVARAYPVRVLALPHGGIARARNAGLDAARGDLIAFLDADDLLTPGSLRMRVERLLERPELDAVLAMMEYFIEPGVERPGWFPRHWEDGHVTVAYLGGLLAWRAVFEQVGPFDTAYEVAEDTEWLARLKDSGLRQECMPDVVQRVRVHASNTTRSRDYSTARVLLRILKESIDRQRLRSA